MPDNVSISYRGANYAIGQTQQVYGIWPAAEPEGQPLEWWPHTPDGWTAAWSRFAAIEVPGTIGQVAVYPLGGPQASPAAAGPQPGRVAGPAGAPQVGAPQVGAPQVGAPQVGAPQASVPAAGPQVSQVGGPQPAQAPAGPQAGQAGAVPPGAVPPGYTSAGYTSAGAVPPGAVPSAESAPSWNAEAATVGAATAGTAAVRAATGFGALVAAGLLAVGVVLGIIGLFPSYTSGSSLASQGFELVPHLFYLAGWAVAASLILLGGARQRAGALLGVGVSAVTLGLFIADVGIPIAGGAHLMGAGLVLGMLGWLACTAGAALAMVQARAGKPALRRSAHEIVPTVTLMLAALGAAIAFAPSWDKITLQASNGATESYTSGNAFSNPGAVIAGDVLVMIALVAVVLVAAFWRPIRLGAALVAGAIIPMLGQAISAIVQVPSLTSAMQAEAAQAGLTAHAGLTPMYWVFGAFLVTMMLLCVWMIGSRDAEPRAMRSPWQLGTTGPMQEQPH